LQKVDTQLGIFNIEDHVKNLKLKVMITKILNINNNKQLIVNNFQDHDTATKMQIRAYAISQYLG